MSEITLRDLNVGDCGFVKSIAPNCQQKRRFIDMGIVPGTEFKVQRFAPLGDPMQILIRGYQLSIRREQAGDIYVIKKR